VMTAVRAYKKAQSASAARKELTRCAGSHFDPTIVRAFLNISIGRLRWVTGPLAWVAQVPFVGWVPRLAEGAAAVGGQAVGVVGTAAGAAVLSSTTFVSSPEPLVVPSDANAVATDGTLPASPADGAATTLPGTKVLGTSITRVSGGTASSPSPGTIEQPTPTTTLVPGNGNANGVASHTDSSPSTTAAKAQGKGVLVDPTASKATSTGGPTVTVSTDKAIPGQLKK